MNKKKKRLVKYAVMINDTMYPDSLCDSPEWAASYMSDAQHANKRATPRLVKVTIEDIPEPKHDILALE